MAETAVAKEPQPTTAVVQWKGESITITFQDVKSLICPLATNQEVAIFLKTCQSLQLNPFANECFLIKYDAKDRAAFVIAIDSYLKAAEANPNYDGCEAGIILKGTTGALELREGAFLLDEERNKLVGGWAKVYRKDRSRPTYLAVNKTECVKLTRDGKPTQFWSEPKQPWMLRKSALKRGLVEAFPSLFAGTLATAEIAPEMDGRTREGTLPPAFQNGKAPDWAQFWVRVQNELELSEQEAHELLGVESVKQLIEQGHTLEQIWCLLVDKVMESRAPCMYPESLGEEPDFLFDDTPPGIDMEWLRDALNTLQWADVGKWLREQYGCGGDSVRRMIDSLPRQQQDEFVAEVQRRLDQKR